MRWTRRRAVGLGTETKVRNPLTRGSYPKLMYEESLISARQSPMNYPLMVMKTVISFAVPQDVARRAFIVHEPAESSSADAT
jgi:hypothetical protein